MKLKLLILLLVTTLIDSIEANNQRRGSNKGISRILSKSSGRPFPLPQTLMSANVQRHLDERKFLFQYASHSHVCDVVTLGFNRYHKIIFRPHETEIRRLQQHDVLFTPLNLKQTDSISSNSSSTSNRPSNELSRLIVNVKEPCEEYPSLESDESCWFLKSHSKFKKSFY